MKTALFLALLGLTAAPYVIVVMLAQLYAGWTGAVIGAFAYLVGMLTMAVLPEKSR